MGVALDMGGLNSLSIRKPLFKCSLGGNSYLAFDFSSVENSFPGGAYYIRLLYADMAHVNTKFYDDVFLAYKIYCFQPA
jgi:hypothetical protein